MFDMTPEIAAQYLENPIAAWQELSMSAHNFLHPVNFKTREVEAAKFELAIRNELTKQNLTVDEKDFEKTAKLYLERINKRDHKIFESPTNTPYGLVDTNSFISVGVEQANETILKHENTPREDFLKTRSWSRKNTL